MASAAPASETKLRRLIALLATPDHPLLLPTPTGTSRQAQDFLSEATALVAARKHQVRISGAARRRVLEIGHGFRADRRSADRVLGTRVL